MSDAEEKRAQASDKGRRKQAAPEEKEVSTGKMHQNVPVWSDPTCACEAEPYWQAVGEEKEQREQDKDSEPC